MAEVRWTLQAASDLEAITDFIAEESLHYARLFAMNVMTAVDRIEIFPASGRIVPEFNDPCLREIIYGSYRIVYRYMGETATILTVCHGARLLDPSRLR